LKDRKEKGSFEGILMAKAGNSENFYGSNTVTRKQVERERLVLIHNG
jgi:hypothetical protein